MSEPKRLKKSETLEIRIPYPTKMAFMARCRQDGRSASEALRQFIEQHLRDAAGSRPAPRRSPTLRRLIVGGAVAAAVGAIALPSLARPSLRGGLEHLDAPVRDLVIKADFSRLDADHDGKVTLAEYRRGLAGARP